MKNPPRESQTREGAGKSKGALAPLDEIEIQEFSVKEGWEVLDNAARHYLKMSGEEFMKAWHEGKFDFDSDRPEVMTVAMLIPFGS